MVKIGIYLYIVLTCPFFGHVSIFGRVPIRLSCMNLVGYIISFRMIEIIVPTTIASSLKNMLVVVGFIFGDKTYIIALYTYSRKML